MLFWLSLILLVVGLVCMRVYMNKRHASGWWLFIGATLSVIFSVTACVMAGIMCINLSTTDATKAQLQEQYKALTFKLESGSCRDEFGLLNKEVVDEIQEWNTGIVRIKALQRNFWIGVCIPDIYDDFETIDYEKFVGSPGRNDILDDFEETDEFIEEIG